MTKPTAKTRSRKIVAIRFINNRLYISIDCFAEPTVEAAIDKILYHVGYATDKAGIVRVVVFEAPSIISGLVKLEEYEVAPRRDGAGWKDELRHNLLDWLEEEGR